MKEKIKKKIAFPNEIDFSKNKLALKNKFRLFNCFSVTGVYKYQTFGIKKSKNTFAFKKIKNTSGCHF